ETRPDGARLPTAERAPERRAPSEPPPPAVAPAAAAPLLAEARDAAEKGNTVRAALLRVRAGAVEEARADAVTLARRLGRALLPEPEPEPEPDSPESGSGSGSGSGADEAAWADLLFRLMKRGAAGEGVFRKVEARLLFDVQ